MEIKDLYQDLKNEQVVEFVARVRSNRDGKKVSFLVLSDGTTIHDVQVVYKVDLENYHDVSRVRVGSILAVMGVVELTPTRDQPFEIKATKIEILDEAILDYPLQKKEHSWEFLREIAHLRARTKTFNAIFRIRSLTAFAIHKFFQQENFVYVNTPIITSNDAEGAGEEFGVITYDQNHKPLITDFFNKKASLTVSGQLNAEAFAQAFKKVYTFGPTFRAESSFTSRHASEFWMIEPEVAFNDLTDNIALIERMLKFVFNDVLTNSMAELTFLATVNEPGLVEKIQTLATSKYVINTYEEVIEILSQAVAEKKVQFENNKISFGLDLGTEHERYLCEVVNQCPTFVINYPKEIKAFYMKLNSDGKTVGAVDLLVPGIGELVGGSQREDNYEQLLKRCEELKINPDDLSWYLDLRRFGYYKSSGFGLGFERLIMYLTGINNIRDVLPFPRTPKNLLF